MHREELWQFQTPMICQYAGSMIWWLTGSTQYFGCNWKLKVIITDEFDDLESMFLTCVSISFSHFQFYWKFWYPYRYICNNWWKRCCLYQAAPIISIVSIGHWELCERHWESAVSGVNKPVKCWALKIQG